MSQIERISRMEKNLNEALQAVENLEKALDQYSQVKDQIDELLTYYGSAIWFGDVSDDEAQKIPKDLNRGVLSEDGINNLLVDNHFLLAQMKTIVEENNTVTHDI